MNESNETITIILKHLVLIKGFIALDEGEEIKVRVSKIKEISAVDNALWQIISLLDGKAYTQVIPAINVFINGQGDQKKEAIISHLELIKNFISLNEEDAIQDRVGKIKDMYPFEGGLWQIISLLDEKTFNKASYPIGLFINHYQNNSSGSNWSPGFQKPLLSPVLKDDKYGFIDEIGTQIIPNIYDMAYPFSEGLAAVKKSGSVGFIDYSGKLVIPFIFPFAFSVHPRNPAVYRFSNGLAPVSIIRERNNWFYGRRWDEADGFIDKTGNFVVPLSDWRCVNWDYEEYDYDEGGSGG